MAGNSLAEALVFGRRAALAIASERPAAPGDAEWEGPDVESTLPDSDQRREIVEAVGLGAGPVRLGSSSLEALERLDALEDPKAGPETVAMLIAGRLLIRAALARPETRGVHTRSDYPEAEPSLDGVHFQM